SLTPLVRTQLTRVCRDLPFRWRFALINLPLTTKRALKLCAEDDKLNALIRTTFAVTQVEAGCASNVLPQSAQAQMDVRLLHGDTCDGVLKFIGDLVSDLGVEVSALECEEPSDVSDFNTPQFKSIQRCVRNVFGNIKVTPALLTGNSDARRYGQYCGQIFRFSPFVLTPLDQNRPHAADEGVRTDAMGLAVCFYRELILDLCATPAGGSE
ncbi:MAG: peptidase dimerization domain-containing protein, partial [Oscillospiraceae bacterium]|nr:peptidase dimerization domain-containing protein [Oscillospiraceae bacterium]